MEKKIIKAAEELSIQAIRKAGQVAKDRFGQIMSVQEKDQFGDIVTEVDFLAEEIILKEIVKVFPDHKIHKYIDDKMIV